jgi:hypothetical protein
MLHAPNEITSTTNLLHSLHHNRDFAALASMEKIKRLWTLVKTHCVGYKLVRMHVPFHQFAAKCFELRYGWYISAKGNEESEVLTACPRSFDC